MHKKMKTTLTSCLEKVSFNINPSYAKPTAVVKNLGQQKTFTFEQTHSFEYPCFATIHFSQALSLAPLCVEYVTQMAKPQQSKRYVVEVPVAHSSATVRFRKDDVVVVRPEESGEGWIFFCDDRRTASVLYNQDLVRKAGSAQPHRKLIRTKAQKKQDTARASETG